ncbi:MAG: type I 3-dehydroquinate dehydratase [Thermoplasmata archaeon]
MIADLPLITVTLPGRTVSETRAEAELARLGGADLAEIRLDRWTMADRARAHELFPTPLPLVATLRSRAEGGEGPDAPEERGANLEALARLPFRWIDLEETRDGPTIDRLDRHGAPGRILSTHLPEGTSPADVVRCVNGPSAPGSIRKVVIPASVGTLLKEILPVLEAARATPTVVLTTGPSGALLRAWSRRFRFPLVYASLPETKGIGARLRVEASQLPGNRLRRFFSGNLDAPLFAVIGHPVDHSRSPYLHSRWMDSAGIPGLYVSLDIASESEFVESLGPLADGRFVGLNVTHPWKTAALEAATRVSPGARLCGAANCLSLRHDEVEAENTDLVAILRRLDEYRRAGIWNGKELVVVGAGGAAAATLAAARGLNVPAYVVARNLERAEALARRLGATHLMAADVRPFSLVVHATSVGRDGAGPLDVPLAQLLGPRTQVLDWVYSAKDSAIQEAIEHVGGRYEDGWRLLVYQAAASFAIWWGSEPAPEELKATISEGP